MGRIYKLLGWLFFSVCMFVVLPMAGSGHEKTHISFKHNSIIKENTQKKHKGVTRKFTKHRPKWKQCSGGWKSVWYWLRLESLPFSCEVGQNKCEPRWQRGETSTSFFFFFFARLLMSFQHTYQLKKCLIFFYGVRFGFQKNCSKKNNEYFGCIVDCQKPCSRSNCCLLYFKGWLPSVKTSFQSDVI